MITTRFYYDELNSQNAIKGIVNNLKIERFIIKMHFYCLKLQNWMKKASQISHFLLL
jgi:ATP sulfurylase